MIGKSPTDFSELTNTSQGQVIHDIASEMRLELLARLAWDKVEPGDPIKAAKALGICVEEVSYSRGQGRLDRYDGKWAISLPRGATVGRKRFACAHELGHFILNDSLLQNAYRRRIYQFADNFSDMELIEERVCDRFAEELLFPKEKIRSFIANTNCAPDLVWKFRLELTCSLQALSIRLARFSKNYAFVFAQLSGPSQNQERLVVSWSASPSSFYIPRNKTVSENCYMGRAFLEHGQVSGWESKSFEIRGDKFVEAMHVPGPAAVFAVFHLDPQVTIGSRRKSEVHVQEAAAQLRFLSEMMEPDQETP